MGSVITTDHAVGEVPCVEIQLIPEIFAEVLTEIPEAGSDLAQQMGSRLRRLRWDRRRTPGLGSGCGC
jgi:hypothetical protein